MTPEELLPLLRHRVLLQPVTGEIYTLIYQERIHPDIHYVMTAQIVKTITDVAWKITLLTALTCAGNTCYTDGSAKDNNPAFLSIIKGSKNHLTDFTGAIVTLSADNVRRSALRVIDNAGFAGSAYDMEFIMLCIASWYSRLSPQPMPITTDCESAQKRIVAGEAKSIETKYSTLVAALSQCPLIKDIKWTRSHPERRHKSSSTWSHDEHGIFLADAITQTTKLQLLCYLRLYKT